MDALDAILEKDVARSLGLHSSVLKSMRGELEKGVDWANTNAGIVWTPEGRQKLQERLASEARGIGAEEEGDEEKEEECQALRAAIEKRPVKVRAVLRVARLVRNFRILLATIVDTGEGIPDTGEKEQAPRQLTVRVRDARKYRIGMEIEAEHLEGATWRVVSPPPRWPGQKSCVVVRKGVQS